MILEAEEECSVGFRCFKEVLGHCEVKYVEVFV